MVPAMSKATVAAGADGVMIEVHPRPSHAKCDGEQAVPLSEFGELMQQLRRYTELEGKSLTSSGVEVF